jgi:SAM-dependent methyltransferase
MWADQALQRLLDLLPPQARVLDIGPGSGEHAHLLAAAGHAVDTCGPGANREDLCGEWPGVWWRLWVSWEAIWASHVLEHSTDPGRFLGACCLGLKPGGLLAVTVPPAKYECVGGHVTLWTAGTLLYQALLAGFDTRAARIKTYGYNISLIVPRPLAPIELPALRHDAGDLAALRHLLPDGLNWLGPDSFDGRIDSLNWEDA